MDPNLWRGVIFTQAALVFAMTAAIVVRYAIVLAHAKTRDRVLPLHIVAISLSYLVATVFICMQIRERWDSPMTYRSPLAAFIFILGDAGLVFMLIHVSVQRKYIGRVRDYVTAKSDAEKEALAAELKSQTEGLKDAIKGVGDQAEKAYHEANSVNLKIAELHGEIHDTQHEQLGRMDKIDKTGTDTNKRVRKIVPEERTA